MNVETIIEFQSAWRNGCDIETVAAGELLDVPEDVAAAWQAKGYVSESKAIFDRSEETKAETRRRGRKPAQETAADIPAADDQPEEATA